MPRASDGSIPMDPGDHEGFTVGCTVRALKNITFKSGRRVDVGDTGTVTKVPGCQPGSPCQVKISNSVFSAVPGDFAPAHGDTSTSDTRLGPEASDHTEDRISGGSPPFDTRQAVPVRLTQYVDFVGHWGDSMQKQKVERLQKQLESAAHRLSEEASAKFEETAWLQSELEKWHTVAQEREKANEVLQLQVHKLRDEVVRHQRAAEVKDGDLAWVKAELQRKTSEVNTTASDAVRLEAQLKATGAELKRLERATQQKGSEDLDRRRLLEKRFDDEKVARKKVEDQLYHKMSELAASQSSAQRESATRQTILSKHEQTRADWEADETALQKTIDGLKAEIRRINTHRSAPKRDAAAQADLPGRQEADPFAAIHGAAGAKKAAENSRISELEGRLAHADASKSEVIDDLKGQLRQRDARIRELEAGRAAVWRSAVRSEENSSVDRDWLAALNAERAAVKNMEAELRSAKASFERRIREAEALRRGVDSKNRDLLAGEEAARHRVLAGDQCIDDLRRDVAALQASLALAEEAGAASSHRVRQLETVLYQLKEILPRITETSSLSILQPLLSGMSSPARQRA